MTENIQGWSLRDSVGRAGARVWPEWEKWDSKRAGKSRAGVDGLQTCLTEGCSVGLWF